MIERARWSLVLGLLAFAGCGPDPKDDPPATLDAGQGGDQARVIQRAQTWVAAGVPYDTNHYHDGYRRDCSGFVSMALDLPAPGPNTEELLSLVRPIGWERLAAGDLIGRIGPGTAGPAGHVLMYDRTGGGGRYWAYELHGPTGTPTKRHLRRLDEDESRGWLPYRANAAARGGAFRAVGVD